MRYFIAYKFTNIDDKDALIADLETISETIKSTGNETFILGRDVKHWGKTSRTVLPKIVRNMYYSDAVIAYVVSDAFSAGLTFEFHLAKLLGKPIYLYLPEGMKSPYFSMLATKVFHFSSKSSLLEDVSTTVSVNQKVPATLQA